MTKLEFFILLFFLFPSIIVSVYHFFLGIAGIYSKQRKHQARVPKTSFAVLIPAHNEELSIENCISSVKNIDYPKELLQIHVIADNCTDNTAEKARNSGVNVLVRDNMEKRGKGYALNEAIPTILKETNVDGIFFMDADSRAETDVLRSLDYFAQKSKDQNQVMQLKNVSAETEETPLSYLLAISNNLENDFFYAPKAKKGLFSILRGTGMYFSRNVLEKHTWNPESLVEDMDMTLELLKEDIPVQFIPEGSVFSEYPVEHRQMRIQRKRWGSGTLLRCFTQGIPLFFTGLVHGNLYSLDAAMTLWCINRPIVIFQLLVTTLLCFGLIWPMKSFWGPFFSGTVLFCWAIYLIYILFGVFRLGLTPKRKKMLLLLPQETFRYLIFSAKTIVSGRSGTWDRTPRQQETKAPENNEN